MTTNTSSSIATAKDVFAQEAAALTEIAERIGQEFECAVTAILECKGRIIFTGMGKHGLTARKTAATMASTGTPTVFLHPAEAAHGDLGMIEDRDLVVAVSNSGNTAELLGILPYIKRHHNTLIAIVGNLDSELATHADIVLDITVTHEACPLNLAPTTSTTAAIAMGDALAVALIERRGFQKDDFALRHPGGSLGKRLLLKVTDVMRQGTNPTVPRTATFAQAVTAITSGMMGAVTVVGDAGTMAGIITDGDVRRVFQSAAEQDLTITQVLDRPVTQIMTAGPAVARADMLAVKALSIMEDGPRKISVLPVLDAADQPVGMLHLHDLVSAGL